MKRLFVIVSLLCLSLSLSAQTWDTPVAITDPSNITGGGVGAHNSMAIVNGNPAIASYSSTVSGVVYVRANDASGTSWGTPVTVDADATSGTYACMVVVNGNPAIAYYDAVNADLRYVRANDVNGSTWGTPVIVGGSNALGEYLSMTIVNGNPAISYLDFTSTALKYVRATDVNGSTWGTKITIATSINVRNTSLKVVNGNPAISYYVNFPYDLFYVRANDANGTTWGSPVTVDATGDVGLYTSLEIVNGNPAISYYDQTNFDLKYVRATDVSGTTWGTPVTLDTTGSVGSYTSLSIINGNPAISYYDLTNLDLKYIRATDASGSTWGTAATLDATGSVGQYSSITTVNGNPAIAYQDATNSDLKYIRASNASGSSWGTAVSMDVGIATGNYTSTQLVGGNPAMSYYDQTNLYLKYVRATNTTGSAWSTPVTVDATGDVGQYTSLAVANSNPAISYYDVTNGDLKYVRASNTTGSSWGSPVTVDATGDVGQYNSLAIVNGNPAIAYYDVTNGDLKYVRATDASGTAWGTPVTVDATGSVGQYVSMVVINGNPAIAYYDVTNLDLKYVRASDASGSSWGTPLTLDASGSVGQYTSLSVVNGNPAIAYYYTTGFDLKYIRASDASGSTWGSAVTVVSTGTVGFLPNLAVVNGKPAVVYLDLTIAGYSLLKYVRATNVNGTAWGTAATIDAGGGSYSTLINNGADVYVGHYRSAWAVPAMVHGTIDYNWTGGASTTDWFTATNWEGSVVPTSTINAAIPGSLSFYPAISAGTATCKKLSISSGGSLTMSGGTLQISDTLSNSGTITTTGGTIELNGSAAQIIIPGTTNAIKNFTLNNSAGATITGSNALNITGTYTPTSGVMTTGGNLVLKSSVTGTARVATGSGTYISGNVIVEKYIPGKRAFRFFAHPFNASIALSQLTEDIDITGSGGAANGFTGTSSNAPSSYIWNAILGNTATTGNNPGWVAFTNTNGAGANAWSQYGGARILVRGAKGEGLFGGAYTPSATTIDMSGVINQGDQVINLVKGDSSSYIMIGNPFPSQVDMNQTTSRTNMGSAYYVWDATQGTRGGYTSNNFSSSYILPAYSSFIATLTANGSITFPETCKASGTDAGLFKTTAVNNTVQLRIEDSTTFWDRFLLRFDDTTASIMDYEDAKELYNPEISFYSFSKDDTMLSIDTRPYVDSEVIQLGIYCPIQKNFRIIASEINMAAGTKLFLRDKFLNKTEEITGAGYEYWFAVTSDTTSWGDNRFELNTLGKPIVPNAITTNSRQAAQLQMSISPNPTSGMLTLYYNGASAGKALNITISNITGIRIAQQTTIAQPAGNVRISLDDYPAGIYIIELRNGDNTIRQKVVRQ